MFQKSNESGAQCFRAYLAEMGLPTDFETFDPAELDKALAKFYISARTRKGDFYKGKSLQTIRYSINRYLQAPPHSSTYDILDGPQFVRSSRAYETAMKEIKEAGKGEVDNTPVIEPEDLNKLYNSVYFKTNTPTGLANVVQFRIRWYFLKRANENIEGMKKDTFRVEFGPDGKKRVVKNKGELTKNHRKPNDRKKQQAVMPATGKVDCPVAAFELYISKLHPEMDRLWVRPLSAFRPDDAVWYTKQPIGKNTLSKFMPKLSENCNLSMIYTNHSIRATGITKLAERGVSDVDICSISTHKSTSSLKSYQETSMRKKVQMGHILGAALRGDEPEDDTLNDPEPSTSSGLSQRVSVASQSRVTTTHTEVRLATQNDSIEQLLDPSLFTADNEPMENTRPVMQFHNCTVNIHFHAK